MMKKLAQSSNDSASPEETVQKILEHGEVVHQTAAQRLAEHNIEV